jgi:enoyl-CoA hydratase/carnithine racemase
MSEPERRNPLTGNTAVPEFLAAIERIESDTSVRAVIITGSGTAFSSGGNIHEMKRQASGTASAMDVRRDYRHGIQRLPLALFNLEVPVIAAVNGPALGAGLDLTCMCDIRIASRAAQFAESFVKLGIIPAMAAPGCCRGSSGCRARRSLRSRARPSTRKRRSNGISFRR